MAFYTRTSEEKTVDFASILEDTASKATSTTAGAVLRNDERRVKAYQDDIDTLLLVVRMHIHAMIKRNSSNYVRPVFFLRS